MADHLSGWEVISKKRDKSSVGILFRDMLLFLFGWGTPHNPPVKFTVREKSTGYIKTVTAYDESELPERIAKGQFDFDRIISEDAAELILAGIRRGGEARALAFDNIVRIGAAPRRLRLRLRRCGVAQSGIDSGVIVFSQGHGLAILLKA
jgi:hypothetical protein